MKIISRLIFVFTLSVLVAAVFSQAATGLSADTVVIHDTILLPGDTLAVSSENNRSVFDINWVTNSIKGGWKISDSLMLGMGLETCDSLHPFLMPVSGKFWRGCTNYHSGWDIGCDYGTPVQSALWGKVRFAGYCSGYGKLVIVRHYTGLELYYAHLSKTMVSVDEYVDAGDTLGLVGATGRARGNHLHLEFRLRDRALNIADYYVQNDSTFNLYKIFETTKKQSLPQGEEYYIIVRGDTLSGIARRYGTSVSSLCAVNSISSNSTLRIGQRLKLK